MLDYNIRAEQSATARYLPICEQVLLDGFRVWARALMTNDKRYFDETTALMSSFVGREFGTELSKHLDTYLVSLDSCRPSPLKMHARGCKYICRDEALMLALVAGVQNENETTIALCLDCLCCSRCSVRILEAAENLATYLKLIQKCLLPVPDHVMRDILTRDISTNTLQ